MGVRGGRSGGPGCGWAADLLPSLFAASRPQACPEPGGCCRLHIRGTAEGAGLGGAGGEGSIVLRECPLFPPWALGEGEQTGTGLLVGALGGGGRVLAILIRRNGERCVRDAGRATAGKIPEATSVQRREHERRLVFQDQPFIGEPNPQQEERLRSGEKTP